MRGYGLALLLPLAACGNAFSSDSSPGVTGTGSGDTRSYPVDGFTTVALMLSLLIFVGEAVRDAFDPRKTFG